MKTNIEYADEVSNPIYARLKGDETSKIGTFCEKPDKDGTCLNCWAEVVNMRFGNKLSFDKSNRDKIEWMFRQKEFDRMKRLNSKKPKSKKFPGLPLVVFCFDTFDIFQPSITDEMRDRIFDEYDSYHYLTKLVQTTYPAKMHSYFKARYGAFGVPVHYRIGMSAGNQSWLNKYLRYLQETKAHFKYIIFEPLLEEVNLGYAGTLSNPTPAYIERNKSFIQKASDGTEYFKFNDGVCMPIERYINQIIVGGESGSSPREMQYDWARLIKKQCEQAGVAFFMKQGSKLKNKNYKNFDQFPADLQIREYPK